MIARSGRRSIGSGIEFLHVEFEAFGRRTTGEFAQISRIMTRETLHSMPQPEVALITAAMQGPAAERKKTNRKVLVKNEETKDWEDNLALASPVEGYGDTFMALARNHTAMALIKTFGGPAAFRSRSSFLSRNMSEPVTDKASNAFGPAIQAESLVAKKPKLGP